MKAAVITLLSVFTLLGIFSFASNKKPYTTEEGIQFFTGTWQQALDKAKKENKYIFLDAYASWCGPCKMMKHKTFTEKEVGEFYNKHFICIAVDMEKGEGPSLANTYSVEAYPTLVFLRPNGTFLGKTTGYHKPKEFLKVGEQVINTK
ncbi:MAG: DUF255 domain-containing protein [Bacteroidetes bacterium]|nr:DUF255 domain-containing protein [Bacteroidota bacterium]